LFQLCVVPKVFANDENVGVAAADESSYEENLKRWKSLSEEERQAIRQKVRGLNTDERKAIRRNAKEFRTRSIEDKGRMRNNYKRFRDLPEGHRKDLRNKVRRFHDLPKERRGEFRRKFREKDKGKRGEGKERGGGDVERQRRLDETKKDIRKKNERKHASDIKGRRGSERGPSAANNIRKKKDSRGTKRDSRSGRSRGGHKKKGVRK